MAGPLGSITSSILQYLLMVEKGIHVDRMVTFYDLPLKSARRVAPACIAFILVTGCSQHGTRSDVARPSQAAPYAIVSSGIPETGIPSASTYSWAPDMRAGNALPILGGVPVNGYVETAIGKTLAAKGYRFTGAGNAQGLSVAYHVALGDSWQAGGRYGMHPGLAMTPSDMQHYEKGTLVIVVFDSTAGRQAWRSALQGFADLDIPADVRQQRINDIIGRMFEGFPRQEVGDE